MQEFTNHIAKLSKAPLQEVIFEAFWELDVDENTHQLYDPGFGLAQGVFDQHVQSEFPVRKLLVPLFLPHQFFNYKPVHQFRKGEEEWPVLQLGPGMLSVNETEKNYIWETEFRPLVESAIDWVTQSYSAPVKFIKVGLRYIDAIELPEEQISTFADFIETNLQVKLVKKFIVPGTLNDININEIYRLEDGSKFHLGIANGLKNGKFAIVWQTAVLKEFSLTKEEIKTWVQFAHTKVSNLFQKMLSQEFYDSLK